MFKRLSGVFVLCVVLGVTATQAFAQDGVKLQYKFVPNQLLRYKIDLVVNTTVEGGPNGTTTIPMTMSEVFRQRVKRVLPDGDAEVAMAYESMDMQAMGNTFPTDVSKMPVITMTMSPAGAVKKIQGLDKMPSVMGGGGPFANMGNFATNAALPLTPVKVGDKWEQDMAFPGLGTFKVQYQLAGVDDKGAVIKQNVSGNIDLSKLMPSAQSNIQSKGTVSMDGTLVFSPTDGRVVSSQGTGGMAMAVNMPNGGTMNINTKLDMTMELLGDK